MCLAVHELRTLQPGPERRESGKFVYMYSTQPGWKPLTYDYEMDSDESSDDETDTVTDSDDEEFITWMNEHNKRVTE